MIDASTSRHEQAFAPSCHPLQKMLGLPQFTLSTIYLTHTSAFGQNI
jgi:hypothetical protein